MQSLHEFKYLYKDVVFLFLFNIFMSHKIFMFAIKIWTWIQEYITVWSYTLLATVIKLNKCYTIQWYIFCYYQTITFVERGVLD